MKLIEEKQVEALINVLAEFPAKHVLNAILMLNQLKSAPTSSNKNDEEAKNGI